MANRTVYSPATLADRWQVTPAAIRRMIREGRLPAFRVGKLYRIKAEVVERIEGERAHSPD